MYTIVSNDKTSIYTQDMQYLNSNKIYHGRSEELMKRIAPGSVALSFWSPPYFVGKDYEKDETFNSWQTMLKSVIQRHFDVLKPGGFMVINIADILCFEDENIPRFQAMNISAQKSKVTREMVLEAKTKHPGYDKYQLAELLGCSEQTIDRRLNGNNIRGGKYLNQTRVKLVGGNLEKHAYDAGLYLYDHRIWIKDPTWANSRWTTNTLKAVSEYEDLYIFWRPGQQVIDRKKLTPDEWRVWGSRALWNMRSVRANDIHEAMFPLELASRVVRLYSDTDDIVLDPFIGSGTTAIAAIMHGRKYIGIDKEEKYVKLAQQKIATYSSQATLPLKS
ncbi:MAG: site-specific DNA-methyltransferase [Patescibacteria group bacterium]